MLTNKERTLAPNRTNNRSQEIFGSAPTHPNVKQQQKKKKKKRAPCRVMLRRGASWPRRTEWRHPESAATSPRIRNSELGVWVYCIAYCPVNKRCVCRPDRAHIETSCHITSVHTLSCRDNDMSIALYTPHPLQSSSSHSIYIYIYIHITCIGVSSGKYDDCK